jgi:PKD repeat protein
MHKKNELYRFYLLAILIAFLDCRCQTVPNEQSSARLNASFISSPASPTAHQSVQFTDTSTGSPTSWSWNFGDGSTATARNPSHVFASTGSYSVALTISNASGSDIATSTVNVSSSSGLVPSDRVIDWGRAGVYVNGVKGIPDYPVGITCQSPSYAVDPTGATDSAAGIQAAINACPVDHAVLLPAGTYRINSALSLKSRVVLRGEEPFAVTPLTKIVSYGNHKIVSIAGSSCSEVVVNVTAGYQKDSDTITVSSASSFALGDIVLIDELNDGVYRTNVGNDGTCTWCGRNGNRAMGELKIISAINGNNITLNNKLYYNYEAAYSPQLVRKVSTGAKYNCGVESLTLEMAPGSTSVSDGTGVSFMYCKYNWLYRVEIKGVKVDNVESAYSSIGNEIRDCWIHDTPAGYNGAGHGYGVDLYAHTTDNLVIDNCLTWLHSPCTIGSDGGTGNVIAYNYMSNNVHDLNTEWFMKSTGTHGAHTHMNLWEGNVMSKFGFDCIWGSGSNGMVFRNQITGFQPGVTPPYPAATLKQAMSTIYIHQSNYFSTLIGNVIGYDGMHLAYHAAVEPYPLSSTDNVTIYRIGYFSEASSGMPSDTMAASTMIRHGNYNYISRTTDWDPAIPDRVLPSSYFLTEKPAWFGTITWPPIGPDLTTMVTEIPAKQRYAAGQYFAAAPGAPSAYRQDW